MNQQRLYDNCANHLIVSQEILNNSGLKLCQKAQVFNLPSLCSSNICMSRMQVKLKSRVT